MSFYDMIGEISDRQATKTETGDTRINGVVVGIVAKNYDKDMPGRVCVTIPTRDNKANELQLALIHISCMEPGPGSCGRLQFHAARGAPVRSPV